MSDGTRSRAIRHALEHPEVLSQMGKNLFMGASPTIAAAWRWEQLHPAGRQAWCDQALALLTDGPV